MLSIFLLAILVLIQIMLVTTIFKNIKVDPRDPHYKKKELFIDLTEVGFMTLIIYLLALNYLEFTGMTLANSSKWSLILALLVLLGYFVVNFKSLVEGFKSDKKNGDDLSQYLAGNYPHTVSLDERYKMSTKYPFNYGDIGKAEKYYKELVKIMKVEFDEGISQEKLRVVFQE